MGQGSIEYKCRRCGKVERAIHAPDIGDAISDLVVYGRVKEPDGVPVHMVRSHFCADGGMGLSNCIGAALDGPHTNPPLLADGWVLLSWTRDEDFGSWILCAATEEHDGLVGWWYRNDEGRWVHRTLSQDGHDADLRDPPLRESA